MRGCDVEPEVGHEPGEAWHLPLGDLQHQPRQSRGVDDWVLERALQATSDEPGVERVVAVLDEHRAVGEPQEGPARVLEHGRADQHRAVDVVAPARVGIDRSAAVDERVEERERALEREALGAQLQDEERCVAGGLDVEGDELGFVQRRERADLWRVDGDLLPRDGRGGAARFEEDRFCAQRAITSARRAQAISSLVTARSRRTAIP
jgi:hypothetical protein